MYKHPGVYIEHVPSGVLAIEAASTSIACFVGPVKRGPLNEPVFIANRGDFAAKFGDLDDSTSGIRDIGTDGTEPDYFGYAINQFYDNGGSQAFVLRVGNGDEAVAKGALQDPESPGKALYFTAANEGRWGDKLIVQMKAVDADAAVPDVSLGFLLEVGFFDDENEFVALESFSGVRTAPDSGQYVKKIIEDQSTLINCEHLDIGGAGNGAQVTAVRGKSMAALNAVALKNKRLNFDVTGVPVSVKIESDLKTIVVTRDVGGADDDETHDTGNAIADAGDVAAALTAAVNLHPELQGFAAKLDAEDRLVLIPPDSPINDPVSVALNAADAGGLSTPLALDTPDALTLPAANTAHFLPGADSGNLAATDYDAAFKAMRDYRSISIVLLPGLAWEAGLGQDVVNKAVTHCEFMKNRVLIVDPPNPGVVANVLSSGKDVKDKAFPSSTFTALYYPWVNVSNPHYDADTQANRPVTHTIPPSGMAAGMWARIDGSRGVWKAPAGLEATVRGTQGPNLLIGNDIQDQLNEWGINCIRPIIGPPVVWGARTLATKVKPDQRYVPVRRTSAMIGESLYNALQAVVFEPNKHTLWASLRASANDFMDQLFRAGAFQGEKASQAYYVKCGLGQTMTQGDIDAGIVRLVVGYAPLKPAEFVVVQIKQIVGQAA